jgi:phosphoribosyl-dephospho-CoA transferase
VTVWHWWCPTHGQIDGQVRVRRSKGRTTGRCLVCTRGAVWGPRSAEKQVQAVEEQLDLLGDKTQEGQV